MTRQLVENGSTGFKRQFLAKFLKTCGSYSKGRNLHQKWKSGGRTGGLELAGHDLGAPKSKGCIITIIYSILIIGF